MFFLKKHFGYSCKRESFTWSFSTSSKLLYHMTKKEKSLKKKKKTATICLCLFCEYMTKNVLFVTQKKMQKIFCFSSLSTSAKESCSHNFHIPAEVSAEMLNQISLKENAFKKPSITRPSRSTDKLPFYQNRQNVILCLSLPAVPKRSPWTFSGNHECQLKHLLKSI